MISATPASRPGEGPAMRVLPLTVRGRVPSPLTPLPGGRGEPRLLSKCLRSPRRRRCSRRLRQASPLRRNCERSFEVDTRIGQFAREEFEEPRAYAARRRHDREGPRPPLRRERHPGPKIGIGAEAGAEHVGAPGQPGSHAVALYNRLLIGALRGEPEEVLPAAEAMRALADPHDLKIEALAGWLCLTSGPEGHGARSSLPKWRPPAATFRERIAALGRRPKPFTEAAIRPGLAAWPFFTHDRHTGSSSSGSDHLYIRRNAPHCYGCGTRRPRNSITGWFALAEDRPLFAFGRSLDALAGVRGPKSALVEGDHELFGFLTTEAQCDRRADPSQSYAGHSHRYGRGRPLA